MRGNMLMKSLANTLELEAVKTVNYQRRQANDA